MTIVGYQAAGRVLVKGANLFIYSISLMRRLPCRIRSGINMQPQCTLRSQMITSIWPGPSHLGHDIALLA
jgi:hypothetical protein